MKNTIPEHRHRWIEKIPGKEWFCDQNYVSAKGNSLCNRTMITQEELERREQAWKDYYASCRESVGYITYKAMQPYFKRRGKLTEEEKVEMHQLLDEMNKHYEENGYITPPPFAEPDSTKYEVQA